MPAPSAAAEPGLASPGFAYGFSRAGTVSPYGDWATHTCPTTPATHTRPTTPAPRTRPSRFFSFQQPPPYVQPPAPPVVEPPGHPMVTDYKWPASGKASSPSALSTTSESEPRVFGIVLKDGSTLSAVAVVTSDDGLHCVDPDQRHLRISMGEVDRAATLKLNRE